MITLHSPGATSFSQSILRMSGGQVSKARGQPGVGIALSMWTEQVLLEWIPVNSRPCTLSWTVPHVAIAVD